MRRLSDNDTNFGPFTFGRWTHTFSVNYTTSGDEDYPDFNTFRLTGFGWAVRVKLPAILKPHRIKHAAVSWDKETIERLGRDWYYEVHEKQFGVSLSDMGNGYSFLQVFYGPQTHDSSTTKSWCCHLPWKEWTFVRHSLYQPDGTHFYTEDRKEDYRVWFEKADKCPVSCFAFHDFDGERIVATCRVEEREWHRGTSWCKWLKYFNKPRICRSLDIRFSSETGPGKGSWKGGTLGHGIDMLPGESVENAFRRYCFIRHKHRGQVYLLEFIGPCEAPLLPRKPRCEEPATQK